MSRLEEISISFRAMNTQVEAALCLPLDQRDKGEAALKDLQGLFERIEERLSRFNRTSELSLLNASAGQPFVASPLLFEVAKSALEAARASCGIFDPTILPALVIAGYSDSFETLYLLEHQSARPARREIIGGWQQIMLDPDTHEIFFPEGLELDLGGIAKGWTVDQAAFYLEGFNGFAVDAGGDVRVAGKMVNGREWDIGVEDPFRPGRDATYLRLSGGAVCTSTTTRRCWQRGGEKRHHLIDPRTGEPATAGIASVTVLAPSAIQAEAAAKVALILGEEKGLEYIERRPGMEALLILDSGEMRRTAGFSEVEHVA
jgi:thiamine biosynthesis lipoprotein